MQSLQPSLPWWCHLNGYHWFVFTVASAAWFFDCLDQRVLSLARIPPLTELLPPGRSVGDVQASGRIVTASFLAGWGFGGIVFGSLGDRFGRAKTLGLTVLIYSALTGLGFLSRTLHSSQPAWPPASTVIKNPLLWNAIPPSLCVPFD